MTSGTNPARSSIANSLPTEKVTFVTPDSVVLVGTFVPATKLRAPAVLLLHMLGRDRKTYDEVLTPLRSVGFATMSIDFRGHGESVKQGDKEISWESFSEEQWQGILIDVVTALAGLRKKRGVDPDSIAIMGASIGANAALVAAAQEPKVKAAVLLSPGLDYRGIKTEAALANLGQRPLMIVAAENDSYSHESSKKLSQAQPTATFLAEKGDAHGTNLFAANPATIPAIVEYLAKSLITTP